MKQPWRTDPIGKLRKYLPFFEKYGGNNFTQITCFFKSVDVDFYFIMIDLQGYIYSGMDWIEGLVPVIRRFTLPPNVQLDNIPFLKISMPNASPPTTHYDARNTHIHDGFV